MKSPNPITSGDYSASRLAADEVFIDSVQCAIHDHWIDEQETQAQQFDDFEVPSEQNYQQRQAKQSKL